MDQEIIPVQALQYSIHARIYHLISIQLSIWGMMACNLLPTSLSHRFCHKDETKGWILIKTSVYGSSKCAGCAFDTASFVARSASSFR